MTVIAFALLILSVGAIVLFVLVRGGRTAGFDLVGWGGAVLCVVGGVLIFFGYIGEHGIGVPGENARQVATFVSVLATLTAFTGGVVWWLRNRPQTQKPDTEPVQRNYVPSATAHAYGTYDAATVRAARQQAAQIRRGVKA